MSAHSHSSSQDQLPILISPIFAILLLVLLLAIPLAYLLLTELPEVQAYLSASYSYMFRNIGLGLAWNQGWASQKRSAESVVGSEEESEAGDSTPSASSSRTSKPRKSRHRHRRHKSSSSDLANGDVEEASKYYPGLVNISGTFCFLNSVLQALASLSHLSPYINVLHARAEELDVPTPVIDALRDALIALNTPRSHPSVLKPTALIAALSAPPPSSPSNSKPRASALFSSREHQDAQELFLLLSEHIKEEASAVERESAQGLLAWKTPGHGLNAGGILSRSPFDGLTANRRSCVTCGYTEAVMHFKFSCWSLSLPRANVLELEDCIADYTRLELLDDCVCRKCSLVATGERVSAEIERLQLPQSQSSTSASTSDISFSSTSEMSTSRKKRLKELKKVERRVQEMLKEGRIEEDLDMEKEKEKESGKEKKGKGKKVTLERVVSRCSTRQSMIARPPPVLALHLNRTLHFAYASSASKNSAHVLFPSTLDLTPYTTSGQLSTRPEAPISSHESERSITPTPERIKEWERTRYRLESVVCHYGSAGWGHYVCYRRVPGEEGLSRRDYGIGSGSDEEGDGGRWMRISDSSVHYVGWEEVKRESSGVFMLFYERLAAFSPSSTRESSVGVGLAASLGLGGERTPGFVLRRSMSISSTETVKPVHETEEEEEEVTKEKHANGDARPGPSTPTSPPPLAIEESTPASGAEVKHEADVSKAPANGDAQPPPESGPELLTDTDMAKNLPPSPSDEPPAEIAHGSRHTISAFIKPEDAYLTPTPSSALPSDDTDVDPMSLTEQTSSTAATSPIIPESRDTRPRAVRSPTPSPPRIRVTNPSPPLTRSPSVSADHSTSNNTLQASTKPKSKPKPRSKSRSKSSSSSSSSIQARRPQAPEQSPQSPLSPSVRVVGLRA